MMTDLILEFIRAIVIGSVILVLLLTADEKSIVRQTSGWKSIIFGFFLIFFGSLIDITDNFDHLNRFVMIGDTEYQALIEKIAGYLFGFLFIAIGFWKWLPKIIEYESRSREEIKRLRGILPLCSHCKKVRDDEGYWSQIDRYISDHSDADFSHGICPDCALKYYPDMDLYSENNT